MGWIKSFGISVCLLLISINSYAIDPTEQWYSFETEHFIIHFNSDSQSIARKAAEIAERIHNSLSARLDWYPVEKTHLVISDETDFSNAYATPYTFNRSVIFVSQPDYPNTLEDYDDYLELLITHEYVHVLHLDKAAGIVSGLRNIFGRHILLFPNIFQPPWLIEGIATHIETQNSNVKDEGTGRGQSSYFQMMMRMEVINGVKPVSQLNLPMRSWPIRTADYLYGVFFYQFMEEVYGKEDVNNLIESYSRHIVPFMINSNAKQVVNKDITELWQEFTDWLGKKFMSQIDNIKQQDRVEGNAITSDGYFTGQIKASGNDLYYVRGDPYQHAAFMKINTDSVMEKVVDVHSNSRIAVHAEKGILVAQPEYCDNYNLNYDLYHVSHDSHKIKKITECGRYRSATWSSDGRQIIAVHINNGINELHLLDQSGNNISVLWKGAEGVVVGQPDSSLTGQVLVASVYRPETGWNIEQFDLVSKRWQKLTSDKAIDVYPVYSDDGSAVVFSSDRNGVYNLYKLTIADTSIEQLTHVMAGAFMAAEADNDIYYVGYGVDGNNIYKLVKPVPIEKIKIKKETIIVERQEQDFNQADYRVEEYSPWSSLQPRWWEPVLFFDNEKSEIGFTTSGHDALVMHNYFLALAYDTKNTIATGHMSYFYIDRFAIGATRETTILSDANANYAATISKDDYFIYWLNPVNYFESSWNFIMGVQASVNELHRKEPWVAPIADFMDKQAGVALLFKNTKDYVRSISENDGRNVKVIYENSDLWKSDFSGEVYTLDWREFIQINKQHTLAIRLTEGWGTKQPENFSLGGESSDLNILDVINPVSDALFGKREYALRGYAEGLPQLRGRRMQLGSIEWRFPLGLVERGIMAPPIGLMQWSGNLFMETGAAWDIGNEPETYYSSAGIEIQADINIFYRINSKLRLGFASGLDELIGENRFYFSLGASF
ncbi:MAG: hypothetical protein OEY61_03015 [Gammaproteobacteria bacterium]|nr:hypothetical protein [Gammaproteobacteria bacterium]